MFEIKGTPFWKSAFFIRVLAVLLVAVLVIGLVRPANAAIAYRSASSGNNAGGSTSLTINTPAGAAVGDVLIFSGDVRDTASISFVPSLGWVEVNYSNNGTITKHTFYRVLTATPPSSYTFSIDNGSGPVSAKASGGIIAYSGVDTANPINAQAMQSNASSTTATAPSITTTVPNAMIVALYGTATGTTSTQGSGMTERYDDASTNNGATSRTTSAGQDAVQASAGASGTKTMTMASGAVNIGHTIALTPAPVVSQVGYRWFANSTTAGTVGSPLAAQDTATLAPAPGQPLRLRMLLGVAEVQLSTSNSFKLQYKWQATGTCDATGTFSDVTSTTPIRYYNNAGVSDAAAIVTNGSDPVRSGVTKVVQTYEELNNFTVATAIPAGQDGMWDFALTLDQSSEESGRYCMRAVTASGSVLNSYTQIPSLLMSLRSTSLLGQEHRYFQNTDSAIPGSALASTDTPVTLGSSGDQFRLRAGMRAPGYFKALAGGWRFTCGISAEKKAYCWGDDVYGQLGNNSATASMATPVPVNMNGVLDGRKIHSISAGTSFACALADDGKAYCWGRDTNGQLGDNSTIANQPTPVAVDMNGVLAGQTLQSVSAGEAHACGIASDGLAYCWGWDANGQLGDNSTLADQATPVAVDTTGVLAGKTILSISAGGNSTCVIASDNQAYCWGDDMNGQLGNTLGVANQPTPAAVDTTGVLAGKTILSISAGGNSTCAVASDNQAYCWGSDVYGQIGDNSTEADQPTPAAVDTTGVLAGKTILDISTNGASACAIANDNKVYCWGLDSVGQLGDNSTLADQPTPVAVDTSGVLAGKAISSLSAEGTNKACVITRDNQSYCWGWDGNGQLGDDTTLANQPTPVAVSTVGVLNAKSVTGMALGNGWGCALGSGQGYCWGSDVVGQLGDDADSVTQSSAVAVNTAGVLSGKTIQSISGKKDHACVIASDNLAYCWGGDANGQLGNDATVANQRVPVAVDTSGVLSGKTILSISAGSEHTCTIASDNLGYCWGAGFQGRLGNGGVTTQATPVAVTTSGVLAGKTLKQISAGFAHTCAIASDDKAYCWGESDNGRLGTGSIGTDALTPVAVLDTGALSGKILTNISAGTSHTCVTTSDNQAYCWGDDSTGQLGNGIATGDQASPVAIDMSGDLAGKTILSISSGNDHTCVIASDNLPYCWGTNSSGQLGRGDMTSTVESASAVSVTGALSGKTILKIFSGFYDQTCVIASDNKSYCWGVDNVGQLGDNTELANQTLPVPVSDSLLSTSHIAANSLAIRLYYAQKTAPTCQAQTGFAAVTNATPISYYDNASVTNGSMMTHGTTNPITSSSIMPQGYYDSLPTSITNQNMMTHVMTNVWDLSLRDNGAPASTTYCLRLVGDAGDNLGWYESFPEITTAAGGGGPADTNAGLLRGGQAVVDGIKQLFSW